MGPGQERLGRVEQEVGILGFESLGGSRAVGDGHGLHARLAGATKVVHRVADHRGLVRLDAQAGAREARALRVGLGSGNVGGADDGFHVGGAGKSFEEEDHLGVGLARYQGGAQTARPAKGERLDRRTEGRLQVDEGLHPVDTLGHHRGEVGLGGSVDAELLEEGNADQGTDVKLSGAVPPVGFHRVADGDHDRRETVDQRSVHVEQDGPQVRQSRSRRHRAKVWRIANLARRDGTVEPGCDGRTG